MDTLGITISSLVLSAFLPISIVSLLAVRSRHLPLSAASATSAAVVRRFDSEDERSAFHDDIALSHAAHRTRVMAAYQAAMLEELARIDPDKAKAYRVRAARIGSTARSRQDRGDDEPDADEVTEGKSEHAGEVRRLYRQALRRGLRGRRIRG